MINPFKVGFAVMNFKQKLGIFGALFIALLISHASVYFIGYSKGKNISKTAISSYEKKVADLRADVAAGQSKINETVTTKYIDRYHTITNTVYRNNDVIGDNVISRAETLSMGWVYAHNQAAQSLPIDPALAANDAPSGVPDATALQTISTNYGISNQCALQIEGWNDWYAATKKMYDDYSANRKAAMEKSK